MGLATRGTNEKLGTFTRTPILWGRERPAMINSMDVTTRWSLQKNPPSTGSRGLLGWRAHPPAQRVEEAFALGTLLDTPPHPGRISLSSFIRTLHCLLYYLINQQT